MLDYTLKPEAAALLDKLGMDMDAVIPYAPSVVTNG
jgi:antitoxin component of RelBE/YafQ-DinJ toxin-antitoxin module